MSDIEMHLSTAEERKALVRHLKLKENMPNRDMDQEIELVERLIKLTTELLDFAKKYNVQGAINVWANKIEALENQLSEKIQLRESIRETPLKDEIGTLKLQLEEKEKELASKDRVIEDLEIQISEMDQTIDEKDANVSCSSNMNDVLETKLGDMTVQLSEAKTLINDREEEILRLKAKIEKLTHDFIEREKLQNQEIGRLTNRVAKWECKHKEKDEELAMLAQRFKETSEVLNAVKHARDAILASLTEERDKGSYETTLNKRALDEASAEIHHWKVESETLRSEKDALAQELTKKDAMLKKKDAALEKAEKSLNSKLELIKCLITRKKVALVEQELGGMNIEAPEEAHE